MLIVVGQQRTDLLFQKNRRRDAQQIKATREEVWLAMMVGSLLLPVQARGGRRRQTGQKEIQNLDARAGRPM
jgi:hypothetical protein